MFQLGANVTCFAVNLSKFGVGGCCQLDLFSLRKVFSGGNCAVSQREICLKVEKNEIRAERADQKQLSNVWRQNTSCRAPC